MMPFYHMFLRWPLVWRILIIALVVIFLFGISIHFVEPDTFPSIIDGLWWAIITASTVGYGDLYPVTLKGRFLGVLLILLGAGFLSTYFVSLAATAVTTQNAHLQGKGAHKLKNHVVIVGWNERAKELIEQISSLRRTVEIVLIDETLQENPSKNHHLHFIKGKPYQDGILLKASIREADIVIITADQNKTEGHADMGSILTLLAIKGLQPTLYCVIEILTEEQVINANRAGANEVIQSNKQTSYVMMNSVVSHGMSAAILTMLDQLKGSKVQLIPAPIEWHGKTFQELSALLLSERTLLLGIKKGEETIVNPPLQEKIFPGNELFVLCD
ncbi:potassium channel family protein [Bacillus sp. 2205SS5-2]|uniref:potassium channel family protein n=1 Tax=Bacillus sp. 2205SS5-2 TaxID=3109031 RepID=UPI0030071A23